MSELQLSLLGLGAVVIAGVVAYNVYVERRARRRAEQAFGGEHPDVLFDAAERTEPTLGNLGSDSAEPPLSSPPLGGREPLAEAAEEFPEEKGLEGSSGPDAEVSQKIDTVAVILADDPVTRESLEALLDTLQSHTTPVYVEGIVDEQWQPVETARKQSWREIRAGLQLASRSGAVTEDEINDFNEAIAGFAASVAAVSQREAPAAAAARARDLDRFAADTDIEVAVNVVGQFGATFALARVKQIGMEHGLSETATGDLVSVSREGAVEFSVRRFDREGARREASYATGLTFALDLPHVAEPTEAFTQMVALAQVMCTTLGGEMVDDNRKPLSAAGIAAIGRQMEEVAAAMRAQGIAPGSRLARRLYR